MFTSTSLENHWYLLFANVLKEKKEEHKHRLMKTHIVLQLKDQLQRNMSNLFKIRTTGKWMGTLNDES